MKMTAAALALFFCVFLLTPRAQAQTLAPGTWTGKISPPSGQSLDITYEVNVPNDSLQIEIIVPEIGSFPLQDIKLEQDALSFYWEPDEPLGCNLKRAEDGSYAGECSDLDGNSGQLTMLPPADGK
jgi:hypothetical protein